MDNYNGKLQNSREPEGRYADQFKVGYRESVFILEFYQSFYEDGKGRVHTRIITSPEDLKDFLKLLQKSIGQYEKKHGFISNEVETNPSIVGNKKSCSSF